MRIRIWLRILQDCSPQTNFILVQAIKKELLDEGSGEESGSGGESGTESDSEVTFQNTLKP
jgi:hypothetical protein